MDRNVAILGLGYVGLPLAIAFAKHTNVFGIDINQHRIERLVEDNEILIGSGTLQFSTDLSSIAEVYIVTVPTPVDSFHIPDLSALRQASTMIGKVLKRGDLVVFESTVYPGCTEEVCVPIMEQLSGLKLNDDFGVGYSPERINPGDKVHTLEKIDKIVSASNTYYLKVIKEIYETIIEATVHPVSSIRVAEAAKVIENAQRDVNISFMNELALIFDRMNIDTNEVIDAASTKWNFMPFRPGLVGGHCIGVDPYYLTYKSQQLGYSPEVIMSGRRVNNNMPLFIVNKVVKLLVQRNISIKGAGILILGFAFKENCEDFRNTRVADMYREFSEFGANVTVLDPIVQKKDVMEVYGMDIKDSIDELHQYDAVILAVAHDVFKNLDIDRLKKDYFSIIFDTKNFFPKEKVSGRL
ncbi:MAG: Vi polysaccharide biosynthesis protein VipA/TviB [Pseudopedobacter saltans]|uniref:Vi polysaccharide biosynthesis protein VipA/TviB n=1 Tax=Pseudopedobacter saltans TaxID=151895 RepID=A0A2W5GWR8_9SPHI|nr:MAG: Vi polysaccharide biosynthesis protein VipA/TviB [Pseudopedobacter saltans]